MEDIFRIRHGLVMGRDHLFSRKNNQDALATAIHTLSSKVYAVGVVADGCGEGQKSEIGAHLGVNFVVNEVFKLLAEGLNPSEIPSPLFHYLIFFLQEISGAYSLSGGDYKSFIKDNLLFTLIGFIAGPDKTVVFSYGDCLVIVNEDIEFRDQGEYPDYIAYRLIHNLLIPGKQISIPTTFDVRFFETAHLNRLAIGTDGWREEKDVLSKGTIWGHSHPNGLQRTMNVLSERFHHFKDDTTLITLEVIKNVSDFGTSDQKEG